MEYARSRAASLSLYLSLFLALPKYGSRRASYLSLIASLVVGVGMFIAHMKCERRGNAGGTPYVTTPGLRILLLQVSELIQTTNTKALHTNQGKITRTTKGRFYDFRVIENSRKPWHISSLGARERAPSH